MKCEFVVGQKVTPRSDKWVLSEFHGLALPRQTGQAFGAFLNLPRLGEICTISSITPEGEFVWLRLSEFEDKHKFDHKGFRPVVEPEADISVFDAILADVNAGKVKPVTVPA